MTQGHSEAGMATPDDEMAVLLPFYLTDTLDGAERGRVERWLATSPHAEAALARAKDELAATLEVNEATRVPGGALARLNADLDRIAGPARRAAPSAPWWEPIASLFDFGDRRLAWATSLALVAALLAQATLVPTGTAPGDYELAAGKDASVPVTGPIATVVFAPDVSIADISRHLAEHAAHLVSGPRGAGIYTVRFETDADRPIADRMTAFAADKRLVILFQAEGSGAE